jgi:hypothetical protein
VSPIGILGPIRARADSFESGGEKIPHRSGRLR